MNLKRKLIIGTIALIALFSIIKGIQPLTKGLFQSSSKSSIYDDNSKIVSEGDSYSYQSKVGTNVNNKTNLKFRFTGMDTIWELDSKKDATLQIDFKSQISNGKFKMVLISPNNKIVNILEQSITGNKKLSISSGKSRIKIVGSNAYGNLQLYISSKDDVKINPINN